MRRKGGEKESKRKTFRNGTWYFEEGWEAGGGARDVIICLFRGERDEEAGGVERGRGFRV